jgi:hypothetical protein
MFLYPITKTIVKVLENTDTLTVVFWLYLSVYGNKKLVYKTH